MTRASLLACCVALAGCAGSSGPAVQSSPRETTTTFETISDQGSVDLRAIRSDPTASFTIAAPADRAFAALSVVYTDLKLDVTTLQTEQRRPGSENVRTRRQLGGTRMSRYLSCGERMGNQIAEQDEIVLTLFTQVEPAGEGRSTLRTLFEATARQTGAGSTTINCSSTGELEKRIVEMVRAIATR